MGKVSISKYLALIHFVLVSLLLDAVKSVPISNPGGTISTKIVVPAIARKAGGGIRSHPIQGPDATQLGTDKSLETQQTEDNYDYDAWSSEISSEEEEECSEEMYFHIRGRQCVPLRCAGGNRWRNKTTGECMRHRHHSGEYVGSPPVHYDRNNRHRRYRPIGLFPDMSLYEAGPPPSFTRTREIYTRRAKWSRGRSQKL